MRADVAGGAGEPLCEVDAPDDATGLIVDPDGTLRVVTAGNGRTRDVGRCTFVG